MAKPDLKILLVIFAVILLFGFLDAEPFSRRRTSFDSRRRAYSTTRRRSSYTSRRRRSSYGSVSSDSSEKSSVSLWVGVSIGISIVVIAICGWCCWCLCPSSGGGQQGQVIRIPLNDVDEMPKSEEPLNGNVQPSFAEMSNSNETDAVPILPYPPVGSHGCTYPPPEDNTSLAYPPQLTSDVYSPKGTGEDNHHDGLSGEHSVHGPGQDSEGCTHDYTASPLPIQFDNPGSDIPPPPSYDDIDLKKRL